MTQPCPRQAEASMEVQRLHIPHWTGNNTCSYCGSMKPEDFLRAVEHGKRIIPTDKNYKAYVDNYKKFYFQHLNDEQRKRFIELYNEKKFKFAYPGHFYVMPYFCQSA